MQLGASFTVRFSRRSHGCPFFVWSARKGWRLNMKNAPTRIIKVYDNIFIFEFEKPITKRDLQRFGSFTYQGKQYDIKKDYLGLQIPDYYSYIIVTKN
jgi:hypothetical protein